MFYLHQIQWALVPTHTSRGSCERGEGEGRGRREAEGGKGKEWKDRVTEALGDFEGFGALPYVFLLGCSALWGLGLSTIHKRAWVL